jgi:hypothetical protein
VLYLLDDYEVIISLISGFMLTSGFCDVVSGKNKQLVKRAKKATLVAVIGDEDTVTGFVLAGMGNVDIKRTSNFLMVDAST